MNTDKHIEAMIAGRGDEVIPWDSKALMANVRHLHLAVGPYTWFLSLGGITNEELAVTKSKWNSPPPPAMLVQGEH